MGNYGANDRERLLAYLEEARSDAARTDEQIERQQALIDELEARGAETINALTALKTLEANRDVHYSRIEMILNQLDLDL